MSEHCCNIPEHGSDGSFKKILWIALVLNAAMFMAEIVSSYLSGSISLLADSIDFLGDASNYAISIFVLGMGAHVRAKASMIKAASMLLFGMWVIASVLYKIYSGDVPHAPTMGIVGILALIVNLSVAVMLYKFRGGDSNQQSVWLCSRNDAIGNVAVLLAALGVVASNSNLPDLIVAFIMGILSLNSATKIIKLARTELKADHS